MDEGFDHRVAQHDKALVRKSPKLSILIVDYGKAFDSVDNKQFGVPHRLMWKSITSNVTGVFPIAGEHTDQFAFEKGSKIENCRR